VAAAAVLTAFGMAQASAEQPESAYLGVGGGAVFLPQEKLENGAKIDTDTGWVADGTLGLRWKSGWRLEIEGAHRENDAKVPYQVITIPTGFFVAAPSPVVQNLTASGKITSTSVMLNGIRDLDMGWKFLVPYVGAGVGWARVNYDLPVPNSTKRDTGGIWQLIGGATFPLCKTVEAFADYRYFDTFSMDDINLGGSKIDGSYHGHEVTAGLRWTFWTAPEPVAAAPAPAPVAQPKDYVIYFEFDKSNVTKAAGAVLDELKATSGGTPVSVVGHTDTMGSAAYNQKLSDRRASNTAKALELRAVKVDSVSGKGFSEPAVNTGPGVKEPLNRRAVIKLDSAGTPTQ
jgi:opacity protein-like surface antigen